MMNNLVKSGCPLTKNMLECGPCDNTKSGGFSKDHGILLCQNGFFSKKHQEHTMIHEMIHMYDHCVFNLNWDNLRHHACSEVLTIWSLVLRHCVMSQANRRIVGLTIILLECDGIIGPRSSIEWRLQLESGGAPWTLHIHKTTPGMCQASCSYFGRRKPQMPLDGCGREGCECRL